MKHAFAATVYGLH